MSPRLLLTCLLWLGLLFAPFSSARAEPLESATLRVDLVIIGPGDALFTRGGHVALLITEEDDDGRTWTTAYNFGDANFDDPSIPLRFVFGKLQFFLSEAGGLYDLAERYGLQQDRDVVRYPVALSQAQAHELNDRLATLMEPGNREYDHHYLDRTCSTKARDLLDEATGGEVRRQLASDDPYTVRHYQQVVFDQHPMVALLSDVLFGRLHDVPISRYRAMLWPPTMPDYLAQVQVPDPNGGATQVPLLGPGEVVASRGGASPPRSRTRITWFVASLFGAWGLLGGQWLASRAPTRPRLTAAWLLAWSAPAGLFGLAIVVMQVGGAIAELRSNELIVSLLVTDLALVHVAWRWARRGLVARPWLAKYATARLIVVALAVAARGLGLFFQDPWIIPVASLACSVGLWWLVRRLPTSP